MILPSALLKWCKSFYPRDFSHRFSAIIALILGAALFFAFTINATLMIVHGISDEQANLELLAENTGQAVQASLSFDDRTGTQEIINNFKLHKKIRHAEVSNASGVIVAEYGSGSSNTQPTIGPAGLHLPTLEVKKDIYFNHTSLGTVHVVAGLDDLWQRLLFQLPEIAAVSALVFFCRLVFWKKSCATDH